MRAFFLYIAFLISLTAQRIFAIKTRRAKTQAAVAQDYLLGVCAFGAYVAMLTEGTPLRAFFLYIAFLISLTAQRIFAIKTRRAKTQAAVAQDYLLGVCAFGAYVAMLTEGTPLRAFFLYIAFLISIFQNFIKLFSLPHGGNSSSTKVTFEYSKITYHPFPSGFPLLLKLAPILYKIAHRSQEGKSALT